MLRFGSLLRLRRKQMVDAATRFRPLCTASGGPKKPPIYPPLVPVVPQKNQTAVFRDGRPSVTIFEGVSFEFGGYELQNLKKNMELTPSPSETISAEVEEGSGPIENTTEKIYPRLVISQGKSIEYRNFDVAAVVKILDSTDLDLKSHVKTKKKLPLNENTLAMWFLAGLLFLVSVADLVRQSRESPRIAGDSYEHMEGVESFRQFLLGFQEESESDSIAAFESRDLSVKGFDIETLESFRSFLLFGE